MMVKICPCKFNPFARYPEGTKPNTAINCIDENTIELDGDGGMYFPPDVIEFSNVLDESKGKVSFAKRIDGILHLHVRKYYTELGSWDTGEYQNVKPGDTL